LTIYANAFRVADKIVAHLGELVADKELADLAD